MCFPAIPFPSIRTVTQSELEFLKIIRPDIARMREDARKWQKGTHYAVLQGPINALALQHHRSRGRTHMVFLEVEHTMVKSSDSRQRLRVSKCGVFKIEEVLGDIERIMLRPKGWALLAVNDFLDDMFPRVQASAQSPFQLGLSPMLIMMYGDEMEPLLRSGKLSYLVPRSASNAYRICLQLLYPLNI